MRIMEDINSNYITDNNLTNDSHMINGAESSKLNSDLNTNSTYRTDNNLNNDSDMINVPESSKLKSDSMQIDDGISNYIETDRTECNQINLQYCEMKNGNIENDSIENYNTQNGYMENGNMNKTFEHENLLANCSNGTTHLNMNNAFEDENVLANYSNKNVPANYSNENVPENYSNENVIANFSDKNVPANYSNGTNQFMDMLEVAMGRKSVNRFTNVKSRIGSLMKNACRKNWGSSQGPKFTGLGVGNVVTSVESRNRKSKNPDLMHRKRFVPKKGLVVDKEAMRNAGKWRDLENQSFPNQPSDDDIPDSMDEVLEDTYDAWLGNDLQFQNETDYWNQTLDDDENQPNFLANDYSCETKSIDDENQQNFLANAYSCETESIFSDSCENEYKDYIDDVKLDDANLANWFEESQFNTASTERIFTADKSFHYDDKIDDKAFTATSINELLVSQCDRSDVDSDDSTFYLEEECIMLSPYSNEARLYRLLYYAIFVRNITFIYVYLTFAMTIFHINFCLHSLQLIILG